MGRAFRKTLYLLLESKSHLELLLGCEHCIPGSESLGEQEKRMDVAENSQQDILMAPHMLSLHIV